MSQNSPILAEKPGIHSFITLKGCILASIPVYLICIVITLFYFTPTTTPGELLAALTSYDRTDLVHYVVMEIKIPRILGSLLVGGMLAIGGATMQGVTKNYLASPDMVGVDSGASLGLAISMAVTAGMTSYVNNILWSMVGAAISTVIIFTISSQIRGRESGVKLLLAGNAIGMLFSGLAMSINIMSGMGKSINLWNSSGLMGMKWVGIAVLMLGVVGSGIALAISPRITILGMGDETAISLGQNVKLTRLLGVISVVLISAATVCTVGNIGFVGLIIPNMVKMAVGENYRKVLPISAYFGSVLLMFADVVSRLVNWPSETPIGTITSIIGIPVFLYLINSRHSKGSM